MHTSTQERQALRQAEPSPDYLSVPTELREIDDALNGWGRWCAGRPSAETSPMFRMFRTNYARAQYGAPTARPSVDAAAALRVEKVMRYLPERARELLRGWYVFNSHPLRLCRLLAIRRSDLAGELNAARRMLVNVLRRH